ncbi:MAG: hypothetical protein WEB58_10935 [Planctomycetaceae bacterium]
MMVVIGRGLLDGLDRLIEKFDKFDIDGVALTCIFSQIRMSDDSLKRPHDIVEVLGRMGEKLRLPPLMMMTPVESPRFVIVVEYDGPPELTKAFRAYAKAAGRLLREFPAEIASMCHVSADAFRSTQSEDLWLLALRDFLSIRQQRCHFQRERHESSRTISSASNSSPRTRCPETSFSTRAVAAPFKT